jgi:hypothetical protein
MEQDMSDPKIRVVITYPVGERTHTLYSSPPTEEVALSFYSWLKKHGFGAVIVNDSDYVMVNSPVTQHIVDALVNQFAEDMGAGREADDIQG